MLYSGNILQDTIAVANPLRTSMTLLAQIHFRKIQFGKILTAGCFLRVGLISFLEVLKFISGFL